VVTRPLYGQYNEALVKYKFKITRDRLNKTVNIAHAILSNVN